MTKRSFLRFSVSIFTTVLLTATLLAGQSAAQKSGRTYIAIPDIPGYLTLKCDFHSHTVFSDGLVWPTVRTEEIWREGLDAFAITDHLEYTPHKSDMNLDYNRSNTIARESAEPLRLIFVNGAEITREMPPGHLNALFLKDVNPLNTSEFTDAIDAAIYQGAFIIWNHPGWKGQQPDGVPRWYPVHTELQEGGKLHGMEIVNNDDYYPEVHRWCLDKKLTMIGCSDIHGQTALEYGTETGGHRPMTLVFAKERTSDGVKDALFNRRTVVYSKSMLYGEEKFLKPIFDCSVEILTPKMTIEGKDAAIIQIKNSSDIPYKLERMDGQTKIAAPSSILLLPQKTVKVTLKATSETRPGTKTYKLPYRVTNLLVEPEIGMPVELRIKVSYTPEEQQ